MERDRSRERPQGGSTRSVSLVPKAEIFEYDAPMEAPQTIEDLVATMGPAQVVEALTRKFAGTDGDAPIL